jgi:hypothetical protein
MDALSFAVAEWNFLEDPHRGAKDCTAASPDEAEAQAAAAKDQNSLCDIVGKNPHVRQKWHTAERTFAE